MILPPVARGIDDTMISVLFSTRNGSSTLPLMLDSLRHLRTIESWELIAVDNASTDSTPDILERFSGDLPLRIMREPSPGKNRALNRAVEVIQGDLVVFTDDDILADMNWLPELRRCADSHPDYDVFAGHIAPYWQERPPQIILENAPLGITYAVTPIDQRPGPIFPGLVWGPNMAVRRKVFEHGHRFSESVGPSPGNYIMGSETEFTLRIANFGHHSWFTDAARVQHIIRPHQVEPDWVIRRAYRFGRNQWQQIGTGRQVPLIFGVPRWRLRRLAEYVFRYTKSIVLRDHPARFAARWEINYLRGYLREAWGLHRSL